jgi:hypothetical protein
MYHIYMNTYMTCTIRWYIVHERSHEHTYVKVRINWCREW